MADNCDEPDDKGDGRGCLFIIGLTIVGFALGAITSPAWGWLAVGLIIVIVIIMS